DVVGRARTIVGCAHRQSTRCQARSASVALSPISCASTIFAISGSCHRSRWRCGKYAEYVAQFLRHTHSFAQCRGNAKAVSALAPGNSEHQSRSYLLAPTCHRVLRSRRPPTGTPTALSRGDGIVTWFVRTL